MFKRLILAGYLTLWSCVAYAQTSIRRFSASSVTTPYLTVDSTASLGQGVFEVAFLSSFEKRALILMDSETKTGDLIDNRLVVDGTIAYGVLPWLDMGLVLPFALGQSGMMSTGTDDISSLALGDPRLAAKFLLVKKTPRGLSVSAITETWAPIGQQDEYIGEGGPGGSLRAVVEFQKSSRLKLALNSGYHLRPKARIVGATVDDELRFGIGATRRMSHIDLVGEITVATDAFSPFSQAHLNAGEVDAGIRFDVIDGHRLVAGGGVGLLPGIGTPTWRLVIGYNYRPTSSASRRSSMDAPFTGIERPESAVSGVQSQGQERTLPITKQPLVLTPRKGDADGDGIGDDRDQCPLLPEDRDQYRDEDGCPDTDNDLDFIADARDKAPFAPEDWDGHDDKDGRPDPDNDGDGLADSRDACPLQVGAGNGCPGQPVQWTQRVMGYKGRPRHRKPVHLGGSIFPGVGLRFVKNEPELENGSAQALEDLALIIRENPRFNRIEVGVHLKTDFGTRWDLWLSTQRALRLAEALTELGVDPSRLHAYGYGSQERIWHPRPLSDSELEVIELRILNQSVQPRQIRQTKRPTKRAPRTRRTAAQKPVVIKPAAREMLKTVARLKFMPRKSQLTPASLEMVKSIANTLKSRPDIQILEVGVHTDGLGSPKAKLVLSDQRAQSIVNTLVTEGIERKRLLGVGYGATKPIGSNQTIQGRLANRRVEFIVLKKSEHKGGVQ